MPEDITSKIISLKSKGGAVFLGQRSLNGSKPREIWEQSYGGVSKKIPAAYVSREVLDHLQKLYQDYSSNGVNRNDPSYVNRLEKLITFGRSQNYDSESGFLVKIVKESNGYYLKAFDVHKEVDSSQKSEEIPDFEEMADKAAEETREEARKKEEYGMQLKDVEKPYRHGDELNSPKPVSPQETRPDPADRYKPRLRGGSADTSKKQLSTTGADSAAAGALGGHRAPEHRVPSSKYEGHREKPKLPKSNTPDTSDSSTAADDALRKSLGTGR